MADKRNRTPFYGAVPTSKLQADHVFLHDGVTVEEALQDYIIEEGTKDGWEYRKWYSGEVECWKKEEAYILILDGWLSHYINGTPYKYDLPFTFTTAPTTIVSLGATNVVASLATFAVTTTDISVTLMRPASAYGTFILNTYVKGTI